MCKEKYLIAPIATSTRPSAEYLKQKEAYELAIRTLKRPKGKWINFQKSFLYGKIAQCSLCDNTLNMDGVNFGRGGANFCPNCGAIMYERSGK